MSLHHGRRLLGRGAHRVIELPMVYHHRHSIVILRNTRRRVGRDDGEAGYGLTVGASPCAQAHWGRV